MSDLISRQAAIDAIGKIFPADPMRNEYTQGITCGAALATEYIEQLPSTQPEIIHCTECKHYREYDSKYVENAVVVQCMADRYPISETIPDGWFCAGAERKNNE